MKLTKEEIRALKQAAINLTNFTGHRFAGPVEYSCAEVSRAFNDEDITRLYAYETGADDDLWGFTCDEYDNSTVFERQLARSLNVLMFLEANR